MIGRDAMIGTFPDERVCVAVFAACVIVAGVLAAVGFRSWLKGE